MIKYNPATQKITEQVEFDFILFASAIIDYDYIMHLISEYSNATPQKQNKVLTNIADAYSIQLDTLNAFIDLTISRYILDEDYLSDLFAPLNLNWKERVQKEVAFMQELLPILNEKAKGKSISGTIAYVE